jgi:excisionase family DNA binding protein
VNQVAELWNVSPKTIRKAIHSNDLLAFNVGSSLRPTYRISEDQLNVFINKNNNKGGQA